VLLFSLFDSFLRNGFLTIGDNFAALVGINFGKRWYIKQNKSLK
jgi:hypothetical protein